MPAAPTGIARPLSPDTPFAATFRTQYNAQCPRCGDFLNPAAIASVLDTVWCSSCARTHRSCLLGIKATLLTEELAGHRSYAIGLTLYTPRHTELLKLPAAEALLRVQGLYREQEAVCNARDNPVELDELGR